MLTPRIVRVLELTEEDLRGFQMGRDVGAGGITGGRVGGPAGGVTLPLPDEPPAPNPATDPSAPPQPAARRSRPSPCYRRRRSRAVRYSERSNTHNITIRSAKSWHEKNAKRTGSRESGGSAVRKRPTGLSEPRVEKR